MNPLKQERINKLEKIKALGFHPYPERFERTHFSNQALELGNGELRSVEEVTSNTKTEVVLCGRMMSFRSFGKLNFAHLQDDQGRIQVCMMKEVLSEAELQLMKLLDVGDHIGVIGELFKTKHGEITLMVKELHFLGKALLPLPEKWHGIQKQETKYRQRYLDMVMSPDSKKRFELRSLVTRKIREFYWSHGFTEIETPTLENISSGAAAKPFVTHHNALDIEVYLRIAAGELWQKTAIVGGFEKTFEVARCFRNEGMDPSHLQEFTMVEHYAAYWNFEDNMKFTEEMFEYLMKEILGTTKVNVLDREGNPVEVDFKTPWPRKDYATMIEEDCGINILDFDEAKPLLKAIHEKGIEIEDAEMMGYGNLVDHLYKKVSRPKLVQPAFVIHHPADTKPLARRNDKNPKVCDTFQLLVNTWEIVNAYSELVDPADQRDRLERQANAKAAGDEEAMSMNEEYLEAMEHGMPPISGWGMGIDRLVTLLTQQDNLRDVVMFPLLKPRSQDSGARNKAEDLNQEANSQSTRSSTEPSMNPQSEIKAGISYDRAVEILDKYIKDGALRNHVRESEVVMRALAKRLGENEEVWGIAGLLHDIDWEVLSHDASQHTLKAAEILKEEGVSDELIQLIQSHTYGIPECPFPDLQRSSKFQHALACGETITGLVYSYGLMRPNKLEGASAKSLKKKFKDKSFAATVSREIIRECEHLGLELSEFFQLAIDAIAEISDEVYK